MLNETRKYTIRPGFIRKRLPFRKWQVRTCFLGCSLLFTFVYFTYGWISGSGVLSQERSVIVRASKPYKSVPYQRRKRPRLAELRSPSLNIINATDWLQSDLQPRIDSKHVVDATTSQISSALTIKTLRIAKFLNGESRLKNLSTLYNIIKTSPIPSQLNKPDEKKAFFQQNGTKPHDLHTTSTTQHWALKEIEKDNALGLVQSVIKTRISNGSQAVIDQYGVHMKPVQYNLTKNGISKVEKVRKVSQNKTRIVKPLKSLYFKGKPRK